MAAATLTPALVPLALTSVVLTVLEIIKMVKKKKENKEHHHKKRHHHHGHEHHHDRRGLLFFIVIPEGGEHLMPKTPIQAPPGAVSSIPANFTGLLAVLFLEAGDDGVVQSLKGPFSYVVDDPDGLFTVVQGAADGSTPTTLQLKDATATGSADVTAEDADTGITAKATITVTPAIQPPPSGPTQGAVFFVPQGASGSTAAPAVTGSSSVTPEVKH
jgi:hypothetical protein